ncbi:MAG: prephenate dehydratase [Sedimentisphaerales bacterium]|nr:prephenate dehydratase [Sedimentisphaerales bacterium]
MSKIEQLRQQIDEIDIQLVELLNKRARVVQQVGALKQNETGAPPIYAPDRERIILDKVKAINEGPLPDHCLLAIYREMMSGSFFLERPLRIAYLGPEGSFSHGAALLKFGRSVKYEPQADIRGVFDEIVREHCDLGVVPVENSTVGGVIETLDSLIDSNVVICSEVLVAIHHNLLANCTVEQIHTVCSKPEVFAQCRRWLSSTLPQVNILPMPSTAQAARQAAQKDGWAAIGSALAAELYGLQIVCEHIEDNTNNFTRFFVIGRQSARQTGQDKTSIVFSTADKAGALVDCLMAFRRHGVNLTNIESHPSSQRENVYYFFVDCEGHQAEEKVRQAIREAGNHCLRIITLGSYPRAREIL